MTGGQLVELRELQFMRQLRKEPRVYSIILVRTVATLLTVGTHPALSVGDTRNYCLMRNPLIELMVFSRVTSLEVSAIIVIFTGKFTEPRQQHARAVFWSPMIYSLK